MMLKNTLWLSLFACTSAMAVNEYSEVTANDAWNVINNTSGNLVFTSVPTDKETDAGVIALKQSAGGVEIKFQEWPYLDGAHGAEDLAILSLPAGRQTLADGTVIEVGTFKLGSGENTISFAEKFTKTPHIFLTGQSNDNAKAYVTRIHGVTQHGFIALKQGEEKASNLPTQETVAYLAIVSPTNTGNIGGHDFVIDQVKLDHSAATEATYGLYLQEEQSKDNELTHIVEHVNVLNFGKHVFAQDVTSYGRDTAAPRLAQDFAKPPVGGSCAAIQAQSPLAASGYYTITPANSAPIEVYCNMDKESGGWTLFATHNTSLKSVDAVDVVKHDGFGVMKDANWQAVRDSMQYGIMFVDGAGNVGIVEKDALLNASCISLNQTDSLANNPAPYGRFWHTETSGCGGSGGDYSEAILNVGWSHVYNFTGAFSKWEFSGGYTAGIVEYYIK
ncbi:fibrinogen-like YCDxxxxGGGW domain-containing protein [Pseudoalteromonas luteoviolacea]|nr:fibrinogen-like YCDxxxxGGGW domain-containing protein [Pseudoalteromonas luteoviolacea]TQF70213.1 hypothetical protein FLM44_03735 [Pseudoalteromonas luteoviolacea]